MIAPERGAAEMAIRAAAILAYYVKFGRVIVIGEIRLVVPGIAGNQARAFAKQG